MHMGQRHWTIVIVPHGSDSPRSLEISQTMVRALKWSAGIAATIVVAAALLLTVSIARGGLLAAVGLDATGRAVASMHTRVTVLQDTILSLERRNDQMRLFAALPATDSAGT